MKKAWSLAAAVAIGGSLLAGCGADNGNGGNSGSSAAPTASPTQSAAPQASAQPKLSGNVKMWTHPWVSAEKAAEAQAMWKEMIASFNQLHPDVKVEIEEIPWANSDQKLLTALAANTGPDIYYLIPDKLPQFASKGFVLPLDGLVDAKELEDFTSSSVKAAKYDGKLYALPILQSVITMFYNVDLIQKIGEDPAKLPTTWEEFEKWADKAKANGIMARNFQGGNTLNGSLYPLLWQNGGDVIDDKGNVILNNQAGVEAFEAVKKLYDQKWIPADSISAMDQFPEFLAGKMLAVQAGSDKLAALQAQKTNFVIGPPLKHKSTATYGATGMFVVAKTSKNQEAAAAFMKFVTNTENAKRFNQLTKYIPARKSAATIYDSDPLQKQFVQYVEYVMPGVMHPAGRSIMPLIQAEMQAMLEGKKSPADAAGAAAKAAEAEIKKG